MKGKKQPFGDEYNCSSLVLVLLFIYFLLWAECLRKLETTVECFSLWVTLVLTGLPQVVGFDSG